MFVVVGCRTTSVVLGGGHDGVWSVAGQEQSVSKGNNHDQQHQSNDVIRTLLWRKGEVLSISIYLCGNFHSLGVCCFLSLKWLEM